MKKVLSIVVFATILLISVPASAKSNPTLEVALLSPRDASEQRIESMLKQYAEEIGVTVDVVYYDTAEEYRESVNAQIFAGEGPDILQAGAIPYWDYAKRGLLDEVGSRIKKEDYSDDLFENIVSGLKDEKGKLYVLPCSYHYLVYILNEDLASKYDIEIPENASFKDLVDMCIDFNEKSKDDAGVYTILGGDSFIRELLLKEVLVHIDFSRGVNNLSDLDNGLLEYINTVSNLSKDYMYEPHKYFLIIANMSNTKVTTPTIPSNLMMNDDAFKVDVLPRLAADQPNIYEFDKAFCITNGKNADLAWELLNKLMEFDNQYSIDGVHKNPIRESATDRRFEAARDGLNSKITMMENGQDLSYIFYNITERDEILSAFDRYVETYNGMTESLAVPLLNDPILSNNIQRIIQTATPEEISSGAVKEEISRVVDVYLSETSGDIESGYTSIYIGIGVIGVLVIGGVVYRNIRRRKEAQYF